MRCGMDSHMSLAMSLWQLMVSVLSYTFYHLVIFSKEISMQIISLGLKKPDLLVLKFKHCLYTPNVTYSQ